MRRRIFSLGIPAVSALFAQPSQAGPTEAEPADRSLRRAILQADFELSKFQPLSRILFYDDFDNGLNGWAELQANHNGNLDDLRPAMRDMRPPQLSNCGFFDIGGHGSLNGTYALKLATRPRPFHTAAAIKRLTYAQPSLVQFEMYFSYKSEQTFGPARAWDGNVSPSEMDFGDFTISNDVCAGQGGPRYMCALRYWNTDLNGKLVRKWTYKTSLHTTTKMSRSGLELQSIDYHVRNVTDWADVPGGSQALCYNELATKINWHYLRWVFDTRERRNTELQVNELVMDLRSVPVLVYDQPYYSINHLLNFVLDVRTHTGVRNFLFVDSVLVSMEP